MNTKIITFILIFFCFTATATDFNHAFLIGEWDIKSNDVDCASISNEIKIDYPIGLTNCHIEGKAIFTVNNFNANGMVTITVGNKLFENFNFSALKFNVKALSTGNWQLNSDYKITVKSEKLNISSDFSILDEQINKTMPSNFKTELTIISFNQNQFKATIKNYNIELNFFKTQTQYN